MGTTLTVKFNLRPDQPLAVLFRPAEVILDVPAARDAAAEDVGEDDAVLAFVANLAELGERWQAVAEMAARDGLAWIACPKGGQLGTDLNRDILWQLMREHGVEAVRQVAVDAVWSALRFRPPR